MRPIALLISIVWSSALLAAEGLSLEEAQGIAERTVVEGGVKLTDFELSRSRKEPSGEWSFLYKCMPHRPDCQFFVIVNSNTGRVTITSELDERRHKQTSARTQTALASKTKEQCEANQGTWFTAGMAKQEFCDIQAPDAGQTCTDSAQCESVCAAEKNALHNVQITGRCDEWHHALGRCVAEVKSGVTEGGRCVD